MFKRSLLHHGKLLDFLLWCEFNSYETANGNEPGQVARVKLDGRFAGIWNPSGSAEHLTLAKNLIPLFWKWKNECRQSKASAWRRKQEAALRASLSTPTTTVP